MLILLLVSCKQKNDTNTEIQQSTIAIKTEEVNKIGLQATIADGEQNILKLQIQIEDYFSYLKNLTQIKADSFQLKEIEINKLKEKLDE